MRLLTDITSARAGFLLSTLLVLAGCVESESAIDEAGTNPGQTAGGGGAVGGGGGSTQSLSASAAAQRSEATGEKTFVTLAQPTVSGGDGNYTMTNNAPGDGFSLGITTVSWIITDGTGVSATANQAVTVADTTAPSIAQPPQMQSTTTGGAVQLALMSPAVVDAVDPNPTLSNNAPAGGFPLGTTMVTWTASDFSGNVGTATQTIVITEEVDGPLTIEAPANVNAEATAPTTMLSLGAANARGGEGNLIVTNDAPAGGFPVGATTVTWTTTDAVGGTATDTQQVTVNDTTAPSITAPSNVTAARTADQTPVTLDPPAVTDLVDSAPTITSNAPAAGFPVGSTTVVWTAVDASGNSATANQQVTIEGAVSCASLQPEFAAEVYPALDQGATCGNCHTPNNVVGTANGFNLLANDQAGFDLFRAIANIQINGESSITVKALGGGGHGGGNRFAAQGVTDPNYVIIRDFTAKATTCSESGTTTTFALLRGTPYEQTYKITMGLGARAPTAAEIAQVEGAADSAARDTALRAISAQLMQEEAFYDRLLEIYNDVLLTDGSVDDPRSVDQIFGIREYTDRDYFESFSGTQRAQLRRAANYGLARAPLELIRRVVETNRPFTEILTADYMMVNPYSATVLGVNAGDPDFPFSSDDIQANHDVNDFRPITELRQGAEGNRLVPIAGVLSTHAWLEKHPTTNTNANRHRAANVYLDFLGVDLEGLAPRDGLNLTNVVGAVPTVEDPQCTVCHDIMDPIAGLFKNRDDRGDYEGDFRWHHTRTTSGVQRMLAPGYTKNPADQLPASEEGAALPWLAARLAADPRFARKTVETIFKGYTGAEPTQPTTLNYLSNLTTNFVASNYNMKSLIQAVITSNYYLARKLAPGENPADFADFGPSRLLTPEELARKIENLIGNGYSWSAPNSNGNLTGSFKLLYGGVDSVDVEERTIDPNSLIDGIQRRIAQQVACERTALELGGAPGNLFPSVSITDTPPGAEAAIRANIQHLHRHLLGEDLLANSTETEATYQLFLSVRARGVTNIASPCRGGNGATDTNGTVIPWAAVVTYLLSDYDFLYE